MTSFLHSLPFHIEYDGKAEIETAFLISPNKDDAQVISSFRGRKLKGKVQDECSCLHFIHAEIDQTIKQISLSNQISKKEQTKVIEWNKEDVTEPTLLSLGSFKEMVSLQSKVTNYMLKNGKYI